MSLTFNSYVTEISGLMVEDPTNPDFLIMLPNMIDYAEQRIYRELDLLATVTRDSSGNLNPGSRDFTLPSSLGRFVVVNNINVITPAGANVNNGSRNPLLPASQSYIDYIWPSTTPPASNTVPTCFAMITDQQIILGPSPGQGFNVEVVGTIRPAPLSATNQTTYLSLYLTDLFNAASMVYSAAWQRNFGSQADDPRMAISWDAQYKELFASASVEEMRKKWSVGNWNSMSPAPLATPPR